MAKINLLPANVYNRIAAGEVIDRPYSVVKELVENAIDAGADEIEIYVDDGGKGMVRVVDNGSGIAREDLPSAFLPHAPSKISRAEDLESILTLGFRGEAVASIASVSKMKITSKEKGKKSYSLICEGGVLGEIKEEGDSFENGTDVCVSSLFFNAPVRLRFLKSDRAEESDITAYIARFILGRPDISFRYFVNGKSVLQSFGEGDESAFVCVYGAEALNNCYAVQADVHGVKIRGYIGNQNYSKPNKSYQTSYINGRYVCNQTIAAALSNAYANYLMKRQYPFYVLHISVPPEIVDVNVHPNKADVRFSDNKIIYGCIYRVVSNVLDGNAGALNYLVGSANGGSYPAPDAMRESRGENEKQYAKQNAMQNAMQNAENETNEEGGFNSSEIKRVIPSELSYEEARKAMNAMRELPKKPVANGIELPFALNESVTEESTATSAPTSAIANGRIETENNGREKGNKARVKKGQLSNMFPDLSVATPIFKLNSSAQTSQNAAPLQSAPIASAEEYDAFAENKKYLCEQEKTAEQQRVDVASFVYAGKLFNTYLIYEHADEAFIIDQHAAHERLIFNRLKEKMQLRKTAYQPMLIPYEVRVNAYEGEFLRDNLENIRYIGFTIDETQENVFSVSAVPADLININLSAFFEDILREAGGYRAIKLEELLRDKLATAACKAAVKGGDDLSKEEIDELFRLIDGNLGLRCPHGRPVVARISKYELEKMFKRIV